MKRKVLGLGLVVAGMVATLAWALSMLETLRAGMGA